MEDCSREERNLIFECLSLRQDYIRKDGAFAEWDGPPVSPKRKRIIPELSIEQMEYVVKIEKLKQKFL